MINLMDVLKEQAAFGFTGKINLLLLTNGQFQGVIYQDEGIIVGASYGELRGKKALYKMIFDDVESEGYFKFIVEPELVAPEFISMKMSFDETKLEAQESYQKHIHIKKLRPPPNLRLVVDPEIIVNETELTSGEFDVLSTMTEWCLVSDIYKHSQLMEFDITTALVGLRKKRAIKVFQI